VEHLESAANATAPVSPVSARSSPSQSTSSLPLSAQTPVPSISTAPLSKSLVEVQRNFSTGKQLDGIISYLTDKHGGNLHDKGIVTVTSKSILSADSGSALRNVIDLASPSYFLSEDEPDQWICWKFHGLRIRPTHYTIKTHDDSSSMNSWTVHGTLDPSKGWTELDYVPRYYGSNEEESGTGRCRTFRFWRSAPSSFIRLTQTGNTSWGFNSLGLCACEIFGSLLEWQE
jgi:hypothetical protein